MDSRKTSDDLRKEIEQTRNDIIEDVELIEERLTPEHFAREAQQQIADAGDHLARAVSETAHDIGQETASAILRTLNELPWPAAISAAAAALFLLGQAKKRAEVSPPAEGRPVSKYALLGFGAVVSGALVYQLMAGDQREGESESPITGPDGRGAERTRSRDEFSAALATG